MGPNTISHIRAVGMSTTKAMLFRCSPYHHGGAVSHPFFDCSHSLRFPSTNAATPVAFISGCPSIEYRSIACLAGSRHADKAVSFCQSSHPAAMKNHTTDVTSHNLTKPERRLDITRSRSRLPERNSLTGCNKLGVTKVCS